MGIFSFRKKQNFFTPGEQQKILDAIKQAEKNTSGEVRVFVESKCRFVDAIDRAIEIFFGLRMQYTKHRNGVLVYVAMKDHQFAVFGDEGIYQKTGKEFWQQSVKNMQAHFNKENYADGIATIVGMIGEALSVHFPFDGSTDKNELPDEIVFGK